MAKKESNDIYSMTTRQLRKEICKLTIDVNERIKAYRDSGGTATFFDNMVNRLKYSSSVSRKLNVNGEEQIVRTVPRGYKGGEIGLGLSYKLKTELQKQLSDLRKFIAKDEYSPQGVEEFNAKTQRQYETFVERYGDISKEEYVEMIDTMNLVKASLKGWGYEDVIRTSGRSGVSLGASLADKYVQADKKGKGRFIQYVEQAKKEARGGSTEDLFDALTEIMQQDGVL